MRGLLVVLLVFFLLLADDVVLQGTARVQPISTPHNGALEKNGSSLPAEPQSSHLANNRIQIVTSAPIRLRPIQVTIPSDSTIQKDTIIDESSHNNAFVTTVEGTTFPTTTVQTTTQKPVTTTTVPSTIPTTPTVQSTISTITTTTVETKIPTQTISTTSELLKLISSSTTQFPKHWEQMTSSLPQFAQQQTVATTRPTRRPSSTVSIPSSTSKVPDEHDMEMRSGPETNKLQRCPRSEDIHPCECVEVATPSKPLDDTKAEYEVETIVFCKNIRNIDVLREALRGMQGHHLTYMVLDSVHLPPFPNDLFKNVGIGWMEVLNSTIQFQEKFFQCYEKGCS